MPNFLGVSAVRRHNQMHVDLYKHRVLLYHICRLTLKQRFFDFRWKEEEHGCYHKWLAGYEAFDGPETASYSSFPFFQFSGLTNRTSHSRDISS